jgi:ssDNA-binding Zn-finger/Zn-ribbon topoisomerase 1
MVQQRLCLTCSSPFEVPATSKRRFCSVACQPNQGTHSRKAVPLVDVACENCGQAFQRKAWEVEKRKRKGWASYCSTECRDAAKRGRKGEQRVDRIRHECPVCGEEFLRLPSDKAKTYCSVSCADRAKRGRPPQRYKKLVSRDGYITVYVPPEERPVGQEKAARHMEHRYVMSKVLGRWPERHETIHHINGNKTDNRPENLQLRNGNHGYGRVLRCRCCGSSDIEAVEL